MSYYNAEQINLFETYLNEHEVIYSRSGHVKGFCVAGTCHSKCKRQHFKKPHGRHSIWRGANKRLEDEGNLIDLW